MLGAALFGRKGAKRQPEPSLFRSTAPIDIVIANESMLPMQIHIGDSRRGIDLQLTTVHAGAKKTKQLAASQLGVCPRWTVTFSLHGHELQLLKGEFDRRQPVQKITIKPGVVKDNADLLGMSVGAYGRLIQCQLAWRRHAIACQQARVLRRRLAAKHIQRELRKYLQRAPRTCFICMDTVPWGEMTSLVPKQRCHRTCRSCAEQHVEHALEEGRMHVRCPGLGCKHLLEGATIAQLASPAALATRVANIEAANLRRLSSLQSEDAGFLAFCSKHARKCPSCHVIIYRHAGCDHMTCRCGVEFDWNKTEAAQIVPHPAAPTPSRPAARPAAVSGPPARRRANTAAMAQAARQNGGDVFARTARPGGAFEDDAYPHQAIASFPIPRLPLELAAARVPPLPAPRPPPQQAPRILAPRTRDEEQAQLAAALAASAEMFARDGPAVAPTYHSDARAIDGWSNPF